MQQLAEGSLLPLSGADMRAARSTAKASATHPRPGTASIPASPGWDATEGQSEMAGEVWADVGGQAAADASAFPTRDQSEIEAERREAMLQQAAEVRQGCQLVMSWVCGTAVSHLLGHACSQGGAAMELGVT